MTRDSFLARYAYRSSTSYGQGGYSEGGNIAGGVAGAAVLVVVLCILAIWATVKAIDLVIQAWHRCQGKSQALRIALIAWFVLFCLTLVAGVDLGTRTLPVPALGAEELAIGLSVLWLLSTIVLLITARVVEVKYRSTFASEPTTLVQQVLKKPWWTRE